MRSPTQRRFSHPPSRVLLVVALAAVSVAACVPTGQRPELLDETIEPPVTSDAAGACPEPGEPFAEYGAALVTVIGGEVPLQRCVLVADTVPLRTQGLMHVTDLAGYDGMLFAFARNSFDGFWMANTLIPLTVAYIDEQGRVVSTADMAPCPEAVDCPTYGTDTPYRWALEVPQGELATFGLVDGTSLDVASLPVALE